MEGINKQYEEWKKGSQLQIDLTLKKEDNEQLHANATDIFWGVNG